MYPEKLKDIEFVTPPEYSDVDIQALIIKLRSFGRGDKIHKEIELCASLRFAFRNAERDGGWTQERKDDFMELLRQVRNKINELETGKAKEKGIN
ncbi:MAG: hypothetical protein WCF92_03485 [bacterium]